MRKTYEILEKGDYTKNGVTRTRTGVNFTLSVSGEKEAVLLLYKKGSKEVLEEIPLGEKRRGDLYSIHLKGFRPESYEYNYRVGGDVIQDPYARQVVGRKRFGEWPLEQHQLRSGFAFTSYDWEEDKMPRIPYEDAVMYHIHVRGFTKSPTSKVRKKGTFAGIIEKIPYLKELGVNQLLLMPVYDFEERIREESEEKNYQKSEREPKINYWGYGKACYFAPKGTFAAGNPVQEMKDLVKTLHKEGIEVLMELFFSEKETPKQMTECMVHWIREYHVDGFYLIGNQEAAEFVAKDPLFADTKLLSPYFHADHIYPGKELPAFKNLAESNDGFLVDARRFLKGDEDMAEVFAKRARKNPKKCGVINYITHHDGFTLCDLVSYEERHNEENGENNQDGPSYNFSWNCGTEGPSKKKKIQELRLCQMKNAILLMMLSQGTPMLMAGDEFGNSQKGNNNPYCQDNEISWLDWRGLEKNKELFTFVKEAIAFRKSERLLHQNRELMGTDHQSLGYPDISYHGKQAWYGSFTNISRHYGVLYAGGTKEKGNYLYVAYNLHWNEQEFAVPKLPDGMTFKKVFDSRKGLIEPEETIEFQDQKFFVAEPRTILVLAGRK